MPMEGQVTFSHWAGGGGFCHWHQTKENDTNRDKLLTLVYGRCQIGFKSEPPLLSSLSLNSEASKFSCKWKWPTRANVLNGNYNIFLYETPKRCCGRKTWPESCLISQWRHKTRRCILGELRQNIHWGQCLYVFSYSPFDSAFRFVILHFLDII